MLDDVRGLRMWQVAESVRDPVWISGGGVGEVFGVGGCACERVVWSKRCRDAVPRVRFSRRAVVIDPAGGFIVWSLGPGSVRT